MQLLGDYRLLGGHHIMMLAAIQTSDPASHVSLRTDHVFFDPILRRMAICFTFVA